MNRWKLKMGRSKLLPSLILMLVCFSCGLDDDTEKVQAEKTCIVYIVADNNLSRFAVNLFHEIEQIQNHRNTNVIVLFDSKDGTMLYKLNDKTLNLVNDYGVQDATSTKFIKKSLQDIKDEFPAKEYGIVFWSHATAWLPGTIESKTRSFGQDKGRECDIIQMANALPFYFDYIIFDACYMASLEVFYEFHHRTRYMLASPIVVPNEGIINQENLELLITSDFPIQTRLSQICDNYISKFNKNGENVSISLADLQSLKGFEKLSFKPTNTHLTHLAYPKFRNKYIFYDIKAIKELLDSEQHIAFDSLYTSLLLYRRTSIGDSGASVFIPNSGNEIYFDYYSKLQWNIVSNWLSYFIGNIQ